MQLEVVVENWFQELQGSAFAHTYTPGHSSYDFIILINVFAFCLLNTRSWAMDLSQRSLGGPMDPQSSEVVDDFGQQQQNKNVLWLFSWGVLMLLVLNKCKAGRRESSDPPLNLPKTLPRPDPVPEPVLVSGTRSWVGVTLMYLLVCFLVLLNDARNPAWPKPKLKQKLNKPTNN